jgi:hypothetical protein
LKKKFQALNRKKVPTGDPNCPPDVIEAKRITGLIKARSNCQNFDDSEDEDDDSNEGIADDSDPAETPMTKKKRKTSWGSKRKGAPAQLVHSSGSSRAVVARLPKLPILPWKAISDCSSCRRMPHRDRGLSSP